jgi:hypothetical protein
MDTHHPDLRAHLLASMQRANENSLPAGDRRRVQWARDAIYQAIEAGHDASDLLGTVAALNAYEPLGRHLILAAGDACDEWLAECAG